MVYKRNKNYEENRKYEQKDVSTVHNQIQRIKQKTI